MAPLKNGKVSVADAQNCRIHLISLEKKVPKDFGSPEACIHEPPTYLGSPSDDYRQRVVIIDPKTKRIVWQYFDLPAPNGATPTHPFTG